MDIINEDNYYVNETYSFAIFFIRVPYVTSISLQESREKFLGSQKAPEKEPLQENLFLWVAIDEIADCCEDSNLIDLLKMPEIKDIISKSNQEAPTDSDDDGVITKTIEFSDDDKTDNENNLKL